MLIKLDSQNFAHQKFSYELQLERYEYENTNIPFLTPDDAPTLDEHVNYLRNGLLSHYCIYMEEYAYKGVIYLKGDNDICIFIAKKHLGNHCGGRCLDEFLELIRKNTIIKQLTATVNINNKPSNNLFKRMGFIHSASIYGIIL